MFAFSLIIAAFSPSLLLPTVNAILEGQTFVGFFHYADFGLTEGPTMKFEMSFRTGDEVDLSLIPYGPGASPITARIRYSQDSIEVFRLVWTNVPEGRLYRERFRQAVASSVQQSNPFYVVSSWDPERFMGIVRNVPGERRLELRLGGELSVNLFHTGEGQSQSTWYCFL